MYGIVLILSLIITGGVIAFIGDRLGTKIGKKRLSIFGLRPRHTSIIITVLTGSLITTLTFCALAAASENVRVALFGMEKLQQEMSEKETALLNTTKLLDEQAEQLELSKTDIETLRKEQKELQAESEKLKTESDRLKAEAEKLKKGNEELLALNDALTLQNETIEKQNSDLAGKNQALSLETQELVVDEKHITYGTGKSYADLKVADPTASPAVAATLLTIGNDGKLAIAASAPESGLYFKVTGKCRLTGNAVVLKVMLA